MKKNIGCLILALVFFVAHGYSFVGGGTLPLPPYCPPGCTCS